MAPRSGLYRLFLARWNELSFDTIGVVILV